MTVCLELDEKIFVQLVERSELCIPKSGTYTEHFTNSVFKSSCRRKQNVAHGIAAIFWSLKGDRRRGAGDRARWQCDVTYADSFSHPTIAR